MPQLPIIESKANLQTNGTAARANPQVAFYQGRALEDAADDFLKVQERLYNKQVEARRATYLSQLEFEGAKKLDDFQLEAERDSDYQGSPIRFRENATKIKTEMLGNIKDDTIKAEFEQSYNKLYLAKDFQVRRTAFKKETDFNKAQLDTRLDDYASLAARTDNPAELLELNERVQRDIALHAAAGWITQDEAVAKGRSFVSKVQEVKVRQGLLNEAEAETTYGKLLDPTQFRGLDEKRRVELTTIAQGRADMYRKRRIAEMEHSDRMAERRLKADQTRNEVSVLDRIDKGESVDLQSLGAMAGRQEISDTGYHFLREAIFQKEEGRTDGVTLGQIYDGITSHQDMSEQIKQAFIDKRLSRPDMRSAIVHNAESQKEDWTTSSQRFYLKNLRESLGAEGFNVALTKEDTARVARATQEYYERVRTGEDPKTVATDLGERYAAVEPTSAQLPRPRFATAKPTNLEELRTIAEDLIKRRDSKSIDQATYDREVGVVKAWKRVLEFQASTPVKPTGSGEKARTAPSKKVE